MKAGNLLGCASAIAVASSFAPGLTLAQDTSAEAPGLEEVVVTGSRIARQDYVAESPIVTVGEGLVKNSGTVSLEVSLNQLPQFTASSGSQTGSTTAAASRSGRANLNLRGLGISRTLVLLDGRRLTPSDAAGAVDLNNIPNSLINNVEIITGGASATYGSDAIAGVVNLKLRRDFNDVVLDAQAGTTERGDGDNEQFSLSAGHTFADDRGHAMLALEYFDRDLISRDPSERSFFDNETNVSIIQGFVGTGNLPTPAAVNTVFGRYGVTPPPNTSTFFTRDDGTLYTTAAPPTNPANLRPDEMVGPYPIIPVISGFGTVQSYGLRQGQATTLQSAQERYNGFARLDYNVTERVNIFGQVLYTEYDVDVQATGVAGNTQNVFASPNNVFISPDLRQLLASRPRPNENFLVATGNFGQIEPFRTHAETTAQQFLVGSTAKDLYRDWTAEMYVSSGRVTTDDVRTGYLDLARLNSVLQAADGGQSQCQGGFDPFRFRAVSDDCRNYLGRPITRDTEFEQQVAEANVQGALFNLPAGELRFALGASYRSEEYENRPSDEYIFETVQGVRATFPAQGDYNVKELYGEVLVPLLKDFVVADALNLTLGYRYSDYSSIGGADSYKAGLEWRPVRSVLLRGGYQHAIRAPSLGDLFAGVETSTATLGAPATGGGDPCDVRQTALRTGPNAAQLQALCLAQGIPASFYPTFQNTVNTQPMRISGNPDLQEESSDSYSAGVVWRPEFGGELVRGLQLSLDYFNIELEQAIGNVALNTTMSRCFNRDGFSNPTYDNNNFYCQLITRATSNFVFEYVRAPTVNLAGYKTWGVDLQIDWDASLGDLGLDDRYGSILFNTVVSYTGEYAIQNLEGEAFLDYKGTIGNTQIDEAQAHPEWKAITSLGYRNGPFSATLRWRYIGAMDNALLVTTPNAVTLGVKETDYFDLNALYNFGERYELRAGVINLTDQFPPTWTTKGATDPFTYDLIGRRFFLGFRARF